MPNWPQQPLIFTPASTMESCCQLYIYMYIYLILSPNPPNHPKSSQVPIQMIFAGNIPWNPWSRSKFWWFPHIFPSKLAIFWEIPNSSARPTCVRSSFSTVCDSWTLSLAAQKLGIERAEPGLSWILSNRNSVSINVGRVINKHQVCSRVYQPKCCCHQGKPEVHQQTPGFHQQKWAKQPTLKKKGT